MALRNGELAGHATLLSLHASANGTIRVRAWSEEKRKLTEITVGAHGWLIDD